MAEKLVLEIPEPNIKSVKLTLVGTSPMIQHRFSEKSKKQILDKQMKKAQKAKEKRNPKKEFEASLYVIKSGKFTYPEKTDFPIEVKFGGIIGIPALWIKQATVSAARNLDDLPMTLLRGALFIRGREEDGLIPVKYQTLKMREDIVRLSRMGSTDLRYRPELVKWECDVSVEFNGDVLSAEQVISLVKIGGFSCGLGEWRPQRSGDFGTYDVKAFKKKK